MNSIKSNLRGFVRITRLQFISSMRNVDSTFVYKTLAIILEYKETRLFIEITWLNSRKGIGSIDGTI